MTMSSEMGLDWGTIIGPIVVTAAYWIFLLVMLPVIGLVAGRAPWRIVS